MKGLEKLKTPVIPISLEQKNLLRSYLTQGLLRGFYAKDLKTLTASEADFFIQCAEDNRWRTGKSLSEYYQKTEEVFHVTDFQQEEYPNVLEGLYHYFAFGREIISGDDLAGRFATDGKIFSKEQMLKEFEYQYQTVISSDAATDRQKLQIMKMIQTKQIPEISQREWDNLTFAEAEKIIAGSIRNQELPIPVALALKTIQRLTEKERSLLAKIIMKQNPATRAA